MITNKKVEAEIFYPVGQVYQRAKIVRITQSEHEAETGFVCFQFDSLQCWFPVETLRVISEVFKK